ncbi:PEP-CTERM sorting domain-containing protein [Aurantiacibacter hainanensis]|uniref:PEP-CTERM sorting domain-containing protein n=1 Tax=Aurantiacibacter hainanensis TaxID=3076114 RepID=UPI0030C68035
MLLRIATTSFAFFTAAPAVASSAVQVPEASTLTLFALGIAGVLIGHRLSTRGGDE